MTQYKSVNVNLSDNQINKLDKQLMRIVRQRV